MDDQRTDRRWSRFEFSAVVATVAAKFLVWNLLGWGFVFITAALLFWAGYAGFRYRTDRSILATWGFSSKGVGKSLRMIAPFGAAGIGFCIVYGVFSDGAVVHPTLFLLLVLYPPWGTVQQFLVVTMGARNVVALGGERATPRAAALVGAVGFALVHVPLWPLVAATFALGLVTTQVYLRAGNLWVTGVFHGWFATLFYFLVLGEDPWGTLVQLAVR
jgi:hypothetical protein